MTTATQELSEELRKQLAEYSVWEQYINNQPRLIELVLTSKSIDTKEEKQNWFDLLPMMNEEQIQRLYQILEKERAKLKEIEEKYEQKKKEIKEKYASTRSDEQYDAKVVAIKKQELEASEQDMEDAEALLDQI